MGQISATMEKTVKELMAKKGKYYRLNLFRESFDEAIEKL